MTQNFKLIPDCKNLKDSDCQPDQLQPDQLQPYELQIDQLVPPKWIKMTKIDLIKLKV